MSLKPPVPPTPLIPTPPSDYVLRAHLPINVLDYSNRLTGALAAAVAAGGADIWMPPSEIYYMPTNARQYINGSNITLRGVPGKTIIRGAALNDGSFYIGHDSFTAAGGQYENINLYGLVIDQTAANQSNMGNANTVIFAGVKTGSMRFCTLYGGNYMFTLGGETLPTTGIVAEYNVFIPNYTNVAGVVFAPVNSDGCSFRHNWIYGGLANDNNLVDAEANSIFDYNRDLEIAHNVAFDCGGIQLQPGGISDPARMSGLRVTDNKLRNCGAIFNAIPGAVISRNQSRRDKDVRTAAKVAGIYLTHYNANTVMSPDNCVVEDNVLENTGAVTPNETPAIKIDGSFNTVGRNHVIDTRAPGSKATWAVQEVQVSAKFVSGGAPGTPSTLTIPISALEIQAANGGAITAHAAQSITLAAASAFDRVDVIYADVGTGVVGKITGTQPPTGVAPAPDYVAPTTLPICYVYVAAGATSVAASNITDRRFFAVNHNQIDQEATAVPLQYGVTKLVGGLSSRTQKRSRRLVTDAYSLAVLADNPTGYWPLLDTSAPILEDASGYENDAVLTGGVLLNQQIGATGRYAVKLDGTTGYAQAEVRPETRFRGALTLEAQVLANSFSTDQYILGHGLQSDFTLRARSTASGVPGAIELLLGTGPASGMSTTQLGTTNLAHIAAVWTGTQFIFYFNGVADTPVASGAPTYGTNATYTNMPLWIGARDGVGTGTPTDYFGGFIRHVALYPAALSGTRIAAHAGLM